MTTLQAIVASIAFWWALCIALLALLGLAYKRQCRREQKLDDARLAQILEFAGERGAIERHRRRAAR